MKTAGSLLTCGTAFIWCTLSAFAQNQTPSPQAVPSSRQVRPLILNQTRYRLRAGDRITIAAPQETLDFVRSARTRTATAGGAHPNGFVVGPDMRSDQVLLGASLLTKPGEYTITVSAVSEAGEERTTIVKVTVDGLPPVPSNATGPPVVLLDGWQFSLGNSCPMSSDSTGTFGKLQQNLEQAGLPVYFFENCTQCPSCLIEDLGANLGQFLDSLQYDNGGQVPKFDLVGHSMGGLIVRSYLAGLQTNGSLSAVNPRVRKFIEIATPNFGSFLAANYSGFLTNGTQAAEMVPGSGFLWNLGTWNQRGDDLRGVDALAIIGNAGYWQSGNSTQMLNASDGVVSLTSASLNFARDPSRTRILPYCHSDPALFSGLLDCSGKSIANVDDAPETAQIVLSFLGGTSAWQSIGLSNQTQYGGGYFALENAAGTEYTPFSSVSLGSAPFASGRTNTIFYNEFLTGGTGTVTATSAASQTTTCGPYTVTGGDFSIFRCKFGPAISSVGPLLPSVPGWVVQSGATITINGIGFGQQQCSTCQVSIYPGFPLTISSWSDQAITAVLPSSNAGSLGLTVQTDAGSDYITFLSAPATVETGELITKNSASYGVISMAPGVIAFSEAPGIASGFVVAPGNPWPPTLGGVSLEITDSQGQKLPALLYYVTTNAMSYLLPSGTALGPATAKLTTSTGTTITGTFNVEQVSPGLFTANATGSGVPAGFWIRVAADGSQTQDYLFDPAKPPGSFVPVPVDLGAATDQVFLSLYGTGFRGATQATAAVGGLPVQAVFAPVGAYQGEDVVNIGPLPRSLAGHGQTDVAVIFDGHITNTVTVSIR